MSNQAVDAVGGAVFSFTTLLFGVIAMISVSACEEPHYNRFAVMWYMATISLILAFSYWMTWGGYGYTTRAVDLVSIPWAYAFAFPFAWYYVGKIVSVYSAVSHKFWKALVTKCFLLSGIGFYLTIYVNTTTPGIQAAGILMSLFTLLTGLWVLYMKSMREDVWIGLLIVLLVLAAGIIVPYILGPYVLSTVLTASGFAIWLLIGNVVFYIGVMLVLYLMLPKPAAEEEKML